MRSRRPRLNPGTPTGCVSTATRARHAWRWLALDSRPGGVERRFDLGPRAADDLPDRKQFGDPRRHLSRIGHAGLNIAVEAQVGDLAEQFDLGIVRSNTGSQTGAQHPIVGLPGMSSITVPESSAAAIASLKLLCTKDSRLASIRVPIWTPSAPSTTAAAADRASHMPPAAMIGRSTRDATCGSRTMVDAPRAGLNPPPEAIRRRGRRPSPRHAAVR